MPDADTITTILTGVQLVIVVASVVYLARQVRGERVATGFQAYSHVNTAYMDHLWLANEHDELNCIWEPWDPARKAQLDQARGAPPFGVWHAMTPEEKRCYRYTRQALEIFEQAWEVRRRNLIGADTYVKWEAWLVLWASTRYFDYVFEETKGRLLAGFCTKVVEARNQRASAGA